MVSLFRSFSSRSRFRPRFHPVVAIAGRCLGTASVPIAVVIFVVIIAIIFVIINTINPFSDVNFRHDNKVGTNVTLTDIYNWAKRPLPGKEIYLVGEAYGLTRHWCEGALETAVNVLKEGWGLQDNAIFVD